MRVCSKCQEEKPLASFSRKLSRKDGYQLECKACHTLYLKGHYSANKDYYIRKARVAKLKQFKLNRDFVGDYLRRHPCIDCGETDLIVLEFDHVRGDKLDSVSHLAFSVGASVKRIMEEIEKCDVRCANCHRRKTATQFGWYVYEISSILPPVTVVQR